MSEPLVHVNSATLIVGPTKSGKTALIGTAAEYLWETYKKVLLLGSTDGGGIPSSVQALMRRGLVRFWRMRTRGEAYETCVRASSGWFPAAINPRTGETKPGVRLVPPITERYTMLCPDEHVVKVVAFQALLTPAVCPTCKKHVTRETMQVRRSAIPTKGFEQVGGMAFDGLSSMQSWMLSDMGGRRGRLELRAGEGEKGVTRITSGDLAVGGVTGTDFGFVQARGEEMVLNSLGIPNLAIPPIWTALLLETTDEGGLPVKGPKLAGRAKTDEAPAWFGNALEIGVVKDDDGHDVRRLSLTEFVDDGGIRHLIGHRGSPRMPPYLQDAHGAPWGQANLGLFFDLLDRDITETMREGDTRFSEAPGLPEGETTYGDSEAAPAPAAAPAAAASAPARPGAPRPQPAAARPRATAARVHPTEAPHPAETVAEQLEATLGQAALTPAERIATEAVLPLEMDAVVLPDGTAIPVPPSVPPPQVVAKRPPEAPTRSQERRSIAGKAFAPPPAPRPPARAPKPPGTVRPAPGKGTPIAEKDIPY